jgi:hypothetical protein
VKHPSRRSPNDRQPGRDDADAQDELRGGSVGDEAGNAGGDKEANDCREQK